VASLGKLPCSLMRETFFCVFLGGTGEESSSARFLECLPLGGVARLLMLLLSVYATSGCKMVGAGRVGVVTVRHASKRTSDMLRSKMNEDSCGSEQDWSR